MAQIRKFVFRNSVIPSLMEVDDDYELSPIEHNQGDYIVYIHQPKSETPLGLFLFLDGQNELLSNSSFKSTPDILEELYLRDTSLSRYLSVFIPSPSSLSGRINEYSCNSNFAQFITQKLIPILQKPLELGGIFECSTDRNHIAIGGVSLGALAATYIALRYPEHFSMVLAQSASFWWYEGWQFGSEATSETEQLNWLNNNEFPVYNPKRSVTFYLQASKVEKGFEGYPSFVFLNKCFAKRITEIGHQVDVFESQTGEHDYTLWQIYKETVLSKMLAKKATAVTDLIECNSTACMEQLLGGFKPESAKIVEPSHSMQPLFQNVLPSIFLGTNKETNSSGARVVFK